MCRLILTFIKLHDNTQVTQPRPNQRGHPGIRVNLRCTKEGP